MEIVSETITRGKRKDIREEIWDLLKSRGYKESSHSSKILKKEIEVKNTDDKGVCSTVKVVIKYKFGANDLQKFHGVYKKYSIPFCRLEIVDGKITKKEVIHDE